MSEHVVDIVQERLAQTAASIAGEMKPDTFLGRFRDIEEAEDEAAEGSAARARAVKAAKRDGVDMTALKIVRIVKDMTTGEAEATILRVKRYLGLLQLPLGAALGFGLKLDAPKVSTQEQFDKWQAGQDGLKAGNTGAPREANPHRPGSETHVAWDKRWSVGFKQHQGRMALSMVQQAKVRDAKKSAEAKPEAGETPPEARKTNGKSTQPTIN